MKYKPLGRNVQIKIREKRTSGGIILHDATPDPIADVIAVGDEVTKVKVGDIVCFDKFAGMALDTKYDRILDEGAILAIVEL